MKKIQIILIIVTVFGCKERYTPTVKTDLLGQSMPSYALVLTDSVTEFNTGQIPKGEPSVIFLFETWCPYCKAQTEDLVSHIQSMRGIHFYLLTMGPVSEIRKFCNHYQLQKYSNITTGIDTGGYFPEYYKTSTVPFFAIYNREKKLKKLLIGRSSLKQIQSIAFDDK